MGFVVEGLDGGGHGLAFFGECHGHDTLRELRDTTAQDAQQIYTKGHEPSLFHLSIGALQKSRHLQRRLGNNAADCAIIIIFDTIDPS